MSGRGTTAAKARAKANTLAQNRKQYKVKIRSDLKVYYSQNMNTFQQPIKNTFCAGIK